MSTHSLRKENEQPNHQKLISLARPGNTEEIQKLIDSGVDLNVQDEKGRTALIVATQKGYTDLVRLLLNAGANPNIQDHNESTALHYATEKNLLKKKEYTDTVNIISMLIAAKADPNIQNGYGQTALHYAAFNFPKAVSMLIAAKADPNIQNRGEETPLHYGSARNNPKVVKALIDAGADPHIHNGKLTALHYSARIGATDVVKELFKAKTLTIDDINVQNHEGLTALHYAAGRGFYDIASMLLAANADLNIQDHNESTALHYAAGRGFYDIASMLLAANADLNIQDHNESTALHYAQVNHPKNKLTLLHFVVEKGYTDLLKTLLNAGANPNIPSSHDGLTVLDTAVLQQNLDMIRVLVESNADLNIQSKAGFNALTMANQKDPTNIVKLLFESKYNTETNHGFTLLHWAAGAGYTEIVKIFLNSRDIFDKIIDKPSLIGTALLNNRFNIVKIILSNGYNDLDQAYDLWFHYLAPKEINNEINKFNNNPVKYVLEANNLAEQAEKALSRIASRTEKTYAQKAFNLLPEFAKEALSFLKQESSTDKIHLTLECLAAQDHTIELNLESLCGENGSWDKVVTEL